MIYITYILLAILPMLPLPAKGDDNVYIVYDPGSKIMKQEAESIAKNIPGKIVPLGISLDNKNDIIVAIGDKSTEFAIEENNDSCIISTYISSLNYFNLISKYPSLSSERITAIFADPAIDYQLELINQLYPYNPSALVFFNSKYDFVRDDLKKWSTNKNVNLDIVPYIDNRSMLKRIASEKRASAILIVPDTNVTNISNFRSILEISYTLGMGVIGYTNSMVKAGASAAIYVDFMDINKGILRRVKSIKHDGACLSKPENIENVNLSVNKSLINRLSLNKVSIDLIKKNIISKSRNRSWKVFQ